MGFLPGPGGLFSPRSPRPSRHSFGTAGTTASHACIDERTTIRRPLADGRRTSSRRGMTLPKIRSGRDKRRDPRVLAIDSNERLIGPSGDVLRKRRRRDARRPSGHVTTCRSSYAGGGHECSKAAVTSCGGGGGGAGTRDALFTHDSDDLCRAARARV